MKLRRWFARWWRVVHLWGLAVPWIPGEPWGMYFAVVAVVEALAILVQVLGYGSGLTWSSNVWDWLYDDFGKLVGWRAFAAAAWSLWFCGMFAHHRPWFGGSPDAALGIFFLIWLIGHFLHDHRRSERRPHG